MLEASGTGHLVGAGLTLADVGLLELLLATRDYCGPARLHPFPALEVPPLLCTFVFHPTPISPLKYRPLVDALNLEVPQPLSCP